MKYDEFIGKVQNRCRVGTPGEAVKATRATLEVLAERMFSEEKNHLASQLPEEIAYYLDQAEASEKFDLNAFFQKVSEKEGEDLPVAVHHARSVMSVVKDAVTPGQWQNLLEELPQDYAPLFESGSEGEMRTE
jgi:uncharacterized protein (DUF2267 family)